MLSNFFENLSEKLLHDRYQIIRQLSKNFNTGRYTLLAKDLQNQQRVVVKILTFNGNFRWEDLKLFEREAETLKTLSHPSIPRYLNYFELDLPVVKGFALVQSYIEAKSLQEYIELGRTFGETELKQLAKSLLEVLNYLHTQQPPVIHRDLKPSNILLGDRSGNSPGNIYLVDFGSVQSFSHQDGTITVVGTYGYMPPEQFGGRAKPASDLYSLGATLIHVATGRFPSDLPQQDLQIQFEQFTDLAPELKRWLQSLTQPSLKLRLTSATDALQALEQPETTTLPIAKKPAGSKISLVKSSDSLEIYKPHKSDYFLQNVLIMVFMSTLMSIFGIFFIYGFIVAILSGTINLFTILILPIICLLWLIISFLLWENTLFLIFGETRFRIDKYHITLIYNLFGKKHRGSLENHISDIQNLVCTERYFYRIKTKKSTIIKEAPPSLYIQAGENKYDLSFLSPTLPERDWLAEELSAWLNLPITRE